MGKRDYGCLNEPVTGNIKKALLNKGLRQVWVAEKAGMTELTLSQTLTNKRVIKVSEITKIAEVIGVDPGDLFKEVRR